MPIVGESMPICNVFCVQNKGLCLADVPCGQNSSTVICNIALPYQYNGGVNQSNTCFMMQNHDNLINVISYINLPIIMPCLFIYGRDITTFMFSRGRWCSCLSNRKALSAQRFRSFYAVESWWPIQQWNWHNGNGHRGLVKLLQAFDTVTGHIGPLGPHIRQTSGGGTLCLPSPTK